MSANARPVFGPVIAASPRSEDAYPRHQPTMCCEPEETTMTRPHGAAHAHLKMDKRNVGKPPFRHCPRPFNGMRLTSTIGTARHETFEDQSPLARHLFASQTELQTRPASMTSDHDMSVAPRPFSHGKWIRSRRATRAFDRPQVSWKLTKPRWSRLHEPVRPATKTACVRKWRPEMQCTCHKSPPHDLTCRRPFRRDLVLRNLLRCTPTTWNRRASTRANGENTDAE